MKLTVYKSKQKEGKNGKPYHIQQVEILQSPVAPNVTFSRLYSDETKILALGSYEADVTFYKKDFDILASFSNFKAIK